MEAAAVVIGAGVVGLAVARRLAESVHDVLVLEREKTFGTQTSSRNSEVIHAGLYYPTGSLKARLCVTGREMLYDYCHSRHISANPVGKLIVATSDEQMPKLEALRDRGFANGVDDLVWLTGSEAAKMEPEVLCRAALFSPSTGIIDSHALMLSLQADAEAHGAQCVFRTEVTGIARQGSDFLIQTADAEAEAEELRCAIVVNCAGLDAQRVARSVEGFAEDKTPPRFLAKGNYFSVSGHTPFRHLIYPMPVEGGLGVHVTLDLQGRMRLGPDLHWVDEVDYAPDDAMADAFRRSVLRYWPGILEREITSAYCGIRPKICGPGAADADFRIDGPEFHGIAGLVNCFGIESPGLTSSLAIANHVAEALGVN